jgi:hypothetical protein
MAKQDHRSYTRPQVDFMCKQAGLRAVRDTVKDYSVAIIMCLMGEGKDKEQITKFMTDVDSLFISLNEKTLSFEECVEDIRNNTGIDLSQEKG